MLTVHRRESFGAPLAAILGAVRRIVAAHPDLVLVAPVHPNPEVAAPLRRRLGAQPRIRLLPPLDYPQLVAVLRASSLVLTDSGGIQEEAPLFGVPLVVLRGATERPEVLAAGYGELVGSDPERIVGAARRALAAPRRLRARSLYGDGRSGPRIARHLVEFLRRAAP